MSLATAYFQGPAMAAMGSGLRCLKLTQTYTEATQTLLTETDSGEILGPVS